MDVFTESNAESGESVGVDPVTQQIVGNALSSIADEMATTLFRTAHSTVVRDGMDFSAALTNRRGETVAQAVSVPFHLGSIPVAMESLIKRYEAEMAPGDIFILNDPFDGGIHLPDIFIARPIYVDDRLVGFSVSTAHHGDIGGRVPGSSACDNTEIFQEGLRIPWLRFYVNDQRIDDIARIIEANVRIPRMTMGDINAQIAACMVGDRGLRRLAVQHGCESLDQFMDSLLDYTERLVRNEIRSWPNGEAEFTDYLDSDGLETRPVRIHCRVRIDADTVIADFSDSDAMVRGALNSTRSFIQAAVYQAVRCALTVEIPNTAGMFRPIEVVTKPGTVTHVIMPGASSMRGVTGFRAFDAAAGALSKLIPDRIPAAGEGGNTLAILAGEHENERFVYYELVCGTWGGNSHHDGNDGISNPSSTAANIPIEVAEREFPLVIERYGLVPDSGGAGLHRGGLAIEKSWRVSADAVSLTVRSDRQLHPPYGLEGGREGAASINRVIRGGEVAEEHPPMFGTVLYRGETYHHYIAGGGGWGDPLARDPLAVGKDVLNGKVTVDTARRAYGVVTDSSGTVDLEATHAMREQLRASNEAQGPET